MRVRSRWHNDKVARSLEDVAGALGFIVWKIAANAANKMYNAGFNYRSGAQQLAVIGEFLIFFIQIADRLVYEQMDEDERQQFVTSLALRVAANFEENAVDQMGPGDYRAGFIEKLNDRGSAYSEFGFAGGEPSYPFMRFLGKCIDDLMGGTENKWVQEHVMEVEAPAAIKTLRRAVKDLLEGRKPQMEEEDSLPA